MTPAPARRPAAPPQKEREERHMALRERLEDHVAARAKADERFQAFVAEEIVSAKNEIATETKVRRGAAATACPSSRDHEARPRRERRRTTRSSRP